MPGPYLGKRYEALAIDPNPIRVLGEGNYGAVYLCKYNGNDPAILSVCNEHGEVAVKIQKELDVNELNIAKHIQQQLAKNPDPEKPSYNVTAPLEEYRKH